MKTYYFVSFDGGFMQFAIVQDTCLANAIAQLAKEDPQRIWVSMAEDEFYYTYYGHN